MTPALTEIYNELKNNTRLRIGLWLIIAILCAYGLSFLNNHIEQAERNYTQSHLKLAKLEAIAQQNEWLDYEKQALVIKKQLTDKLWVTESEGLAKADFHTWISQLIDKTKIPEPRFKIAEVMPIEEQDIWKVSVRLNGLFNAKAINQLLLEIHNFPKLVVIERFDVRNKKDLRFYTIISAYFQQATLKSQ